MKNRTKIFLNNGNSYHISRYNTIRKIKYGYQSIFKCKTLHLTYKEYINSIL